jgi:ribosomal protein L20
MFTEPIGCVASYDSEYHRQNEYIDEINLIQSFTTACATVRSRQLTHQTQLFNQMKSTNVNVTREVLSRVALSSVVG